MARTDSTWMAQNSIYYQFWVKALPNRQTQDIFLLLKDLRKSGHLYHTVVLHTGSNGLYSASTLNGIVTQMSNLGVRKIYMLNVRVPMGWEGLVNDHIDEVAQNWPELVVLVDWHEISGGHPEWFLDDGVHLTKDGAQAYVDITLETIRLEGCSP